MPACCRASIVWRVVVDLWMSKVSAKTTSEVSWLGKDRPFQHREPRTTSPLGPHRYGRPTTTNTSVKPSDQATVDASRLAPTIGGPFLSSFCHLPPLVKARLLHWNCLHQSWLARESRRVFAATRRTHKQDKALVVNACHARPSKRQQPRLWPHTVRVADRLVVAPRKK
jgi:hypothetical protein